MSGVSILSLGENYVNPFDRVDRNLSITSIVPLISTLVAPKLHRKSTLRADLLGIPVPDRPFVFPLVCARGSLKAGSASIPSLYPGREPFTSFWTDSANMRSLFFCRECSDHSIKCFDGLIFYSLIISVYQTRINHVTSSKS